MGHGSGLGKRLLMHDNDSSSATIAEVKIPWWRSVLPLALGLVVVALCLIQGRPTAASEPGVVMSLPYNVGNFWGKGQEISVAEKLVLPPDTQIERKIYSNVHQDEIQCSIVLSGVERRSIHRPEICLPGQGWTIRSSSIVPVRLSTGKTLRVKELLLDRDVVVGPNDKRRIEAVFDYWFIGKRIATPEHFIRVFYSAWDLLAHNINHRWAYVSVMSLVQGTVRFDGKSLPETQEMLKNFIGEVTPTFQISEMSPEALKEAGVKP